MSLWGLGGDMSLSLSSGRRGHSGEAGDGPGPDGHIDPARSTNLLQSASGLLGETCLAQLGSCVGKNHYRLHSVFERPEDC